MTWLLLSHLQSFYFLFLSVGGQSLSLQHGWLGGSHEVVSQDPTGGLAYAFLSLMAPGTWLLGLVMCVLIGMQSSQLIAGCVWGTWGWCQPDGGCGWSWAGGCCWHGWAGLVQLAPQSPVYDGVEWLWLAGRLWDHRFGAHVLSGGDLVPGWLAVLAWWCIYFFLVLLSFSS